MSWGKSTEFENISGQVAIIGIGESDYNSPRIESKAHYIVNNLRLIGQAKDR